MELTKIRTFFEPQHITTPIIPVGLTFDFLTDYNNNALIYDKYFLNMYGDLAIDNSIVGTSVGDTRSNIWAQIIACLTTNARALQRLYDVSKEDYNPLWNVDGTVTTTRNNGARSESFAYGKTKETTAIGEQNTTMTHGAGTDTASVERDKYGYNDENNTLDTKDTTTSTHGAFTDTNKNNARTDTRENDARTDTHSNNAYTDTETVVRTGNIGVTKSTELFADEVELWSNFNFYEKLFGMIFASITVPIYVEG